MSRTKFSAACAAALSLSLLAAPIAFSQQQQGAQQQGAQQQGQKGQQNQAQVEKVIQDWKDQPKQVAREMMQKYGVPQEITSQRLVWHNNGPWKRTELINEEIDHDFPLPHKDMLKQTVEYQVPADKFDELAAYDGSVIVDRTRGEISARCDKEAANILALNLAHDVITGKKSVEEARTTYGESIVASAKGKPVPVMQQLNFEPMQNAGFSDKTTLDQATVENVKQMMKQESAGGR
jgi:hypothetical protein